MNTPLSRRSTITTTSALGLGLFANGLNANETTNGPGFGSAKSIIVLNVKGGMSHIDTLDPKDGSSKGPYKAIRTSADFLVTEVLPQTAKIANKISLIRSMTAKVGVHGPAQYFMRTGFAQRNTIKHPNLGAWAEHYLGASHDTLPSSACINQGSMYGNGFFSPSLSPIPILAPEVGLQNVQLKNGPKKLINKLELSKQLSSNFTKKYPDSEVKAYGEFYDNTIKLLSSKDLDAFNVHLEPEAMKEKYGKNKFGQGCLLARRLVEAGVRFVEVASEGWDMHKTLKSDMDEIAPPFDQTYAALIKDLEERGLLSSTLVVLTTEFGRKPSFSGGGRSHYPICFTTALAGAGVKQGFVYGESDERGAEPSKPVTIGDFHATIGWAAGLPLKEEFETSTGRPFTIGGSTAKPVLELFS